MTASVRLDEELENTLKKLSSTLRRKKSEVIREAIRHYAIKVEEEKRSRLARAVEKTKTNDPELYRDFEGTIDDGLQG